MWQSVVNKLCELSMYRVVDSEHRRHGASLQCSLLLARVRVLSQSYHSRQTEQLADGAKVAGGGVFAAHIFVPTLEQQLRVFVELNSSMFLNVRLIKYKYQVK